MVNNKLWTYGISTIVVVLVGVATFDILMTTHKHPQPTVSTGNAVLPSTQQQPVKPTIQPATVIAPMKSLPASVMNHLSSYASRIQSGSPSFPVTGNSLLVIAPSEQYAITQLQAVWQKVQPVEVIWTSTQAMTEKTWVKEGYKSDPLPSAHTTFSNASLFTPVAYHRAGTKWQVLNGVLRPSQSMDWVTFFRG